MATANDFVHPTLSSTAPRATVRELERAVEDLTRVLLRERRLSNQETIAILQASGCSAREVTLALKRVGHVAPV